MRSLMYTCASLATHVWRVGVAFVKQVSMVEMLLNWTLLLPYAGINVHPWTLQGHQGLSSGRTLLRSNNSNSMVFDLLGSIP